jgi:hypothetical protein
VKEKRDQKTRKCGKDEKDTVKKNMEKKRRGGEDSGRGLEEEISEKGGRRQRRVR